MPPRKRQVEEIIDYRQVGRNHRNVVNNAAGSGNITRLIRFSEDYIQYKEFCEGLLNDTFNDQFPLISAAKEGNFEIVKHLMGLGADPNVRGSIDLPGEKNIKGATPLWAAAAKGQFEVVKYLIEECKVDVDVTSNHNSTPLRAACHDGHLDIVKYLLEKGADPNIPNRHLHTSLMMAAYKNRLDVVRALLKTNVDINAKTLQGSTALHDAAESGNLELVKLLMDAKATMEVDAYGVTPLLSAANHGAKESFEYIVGLRESNLEKQDAWKLMGCTHIDRTKDDALALECWRTALSIELTPEEAEIVAQRRAAETPGQMYEYATEVNSLNELELISTNEELLKFQSLLMRERLLGESHSDVHRYIKTRADAQSTARKFENAFALYTHALRLMRKYNKPIHMPSIKLLEAFQNELTTAIQRYLSELRGECPIKYIWAENLYNLLCEECELLAEWKAKPTEQKHNINYEHPPSIESEVRKLVFAALKICGAIEVMKLEIVNVPDVIPHSDTYSLKRLVHVSDKLNCNLIHLLLEDEVQQRANGQEEWSSARETLFTQLLANGVCPSQVNDQKMSPLHKVLDSHPLNVPRIKLLLDHGATLFACDKNGNIVYQMIQDRIKSGKITHEDLDLGKYITLFGLAAHAIVRKHNIPIHKDDFLPTQYRFMLQH